MTENADAVGCSAGKKEENAVDSASAKIANNAETNVKCKRKLSDLGDFIEKPSNGDGFRETKSSDKTLSILG